MTRKFRKDAAANREAVRARLATHLGISRGEIGQRLSLSPMGVTRHVMAIRSEWGPPALPNRRPRRPRQSEQEAAAHD